MAGASGQARYGIAIFHGLGDVLNCTPLARQLKTDDPGCHITWFAAERTGFVLDHNPDIDDLVLLPGDPLALDGRIQELEASGSWDRFFTPAPYLNYREHPGASLYELIRLATGLDYTIPFWSVLRLREEEITEARAHWNSLPQGPRILLETEFQSDQSHWIDPCALDVFEALKPLDPLLVFTGRNRPGILDELEARGARVAFTSAPLRQTAEFYNLADAFIGVSSGISCISLSTHCRRDVPSIEYCRGEHWSTAHWNHPQERTYAYTYPRFLDALQVLAARLSGQPQPSRDFRPTPGALAPMPDGPGQTPCPACGSDRAHSGRTADLVQCCACDLIYRRDRPPVEAPGLAPLPGFPRPRSRAEADSESTARATRRIAQREELLARMGRRPEGLRVFDVACGWGAWLAGCREVGMTVSGVESSPADLQFAQDVLGLPVALGSFPGKGAPEESQDLVTCIHALDRLENPFEVLTQAFNLLAPGGWLYVVVPNFDSFCSGLLGEGWPWVDPRWHGMHFTRKTLLDLVFQAGFQLESLASATGDFGRENMLDLLRSQFPTAPAEALSLALDHMDRTGKGAEWRLLARKRGRSRGPLLPEREERPSCPLDTRTPLGRRLVQVFEEAPPQRILRCGTQALPHSRTLLARSVRSQAKSGTTFLCVEEVEPGQDPVIAELDRFGLTPWVDAWLVGLSLPRREGPLHPTKEVPADARLDDLLRLALKRLGYRPDLVLVAGEGPWLHAQLGKLLDQVEAPTRILLEGPEGTLRDLQIAREGEPRLQDWRLEAGFLEVHLVPGAVPAKAKVERILWIWTGDLAEAVLAASTLPLLAAKHPAAELYVVCEAQASPLFEACPQVRACLSFRRGLPASEAQEELRNLVQKVGALRADLCLCPAPSRDGLEDQLVAVSGAWMRVGFGGLEPKLPGGGPPSHALFTTLVPPLPEGNELDRYTHFLQALGITVEGLQAQVWTTDQDERFAREWFKQKGLSPQRTVAVFAGDRAAARVYGGYGSALKAGLAGDDWTLLALGTEGEKALNQGVLDAFGGRAHNLCGKLTLRQSAALLRHCALAVGAESHFAHLATAVGTPQVVVVGGGEFGRYVPSAPLTSVAALPLSCYLCGWNCPYAQAHCLNDLHEDVLAEAIRQTLAGPAPRPRLFVQAHYAPREDGPDLIDLSGAVDPANVILIPVIAEATQA